MPMPSVMIRPPISAIGAGHDKGPVDGTPFSAPLPCLRVDDALGEVFRRVGLGRGEPRPGARCADRRRAFEAELRAGRQLCAAVGAPESQWRRALQAELRRGRVLLLAPGTFHAEPPGSGSGLRNRTESAHVAAESTSTCRTSLTA